ncbi:hypothetical protein HMPREF9997_02545 [Corynebacterium durum F0235]|uniref:Uncharacterized protein n=1 Tax=Corynebacterium durum F0235 TaxID=1035195 RepID=L1M957_9CORY|nr:hypothetical protein HMPREF9997_02545 [Corynebacterium durum F0235]
MGGCWARGGDISLSLNTKKGCCCTWRWTSLAVDEWLTRVDMELS